MGLHIAILTVDIDGLARFDSAHAPGYASAGAQDYWRLSASTCTS